MPVKIVLGMIALLILMIMSYAPLNTALTSNDGFSSMDTILPHTTIIAVITNIGL
jgi:hypothetical protein